MAGVFCVMPMDLFSASSEQLREEQAPLADRMRPRTLDEVVGQERAKAPGTALRRLFDGRGMGSIILHGPPGTGKTTLARLAAARKDAHFESVNAVTSGVAEVRQKLQEARERQRFHGKSTILFIDEIHRFNKAQQDALLPAVEDGTITLIGATTENPFFEVNAPLLSRASVVRLDPLTDDDVASLIQRALDDGERGLGGLGLELSPEAETHLLTLARGDARAALNALELAADGALARGDRRITVEDVASAASGPLVRYDKSGDNHYDVISAFIKSIRGSDPDAALHWLARMLSAGEDPGFIARRLVVHASEDIGNADPMALVVATSAAAAVDRIGMPECRLALAQAAIYLATAPKSNASYVGIEKALDDVRTRSIGEVPPHLRDSSYQGAAALGHGKGYRYPHNEPSGYVEQQYMPDELHGRQYYHPVERGHERVIGERLRAWRKRD